MAKHARQISEAKGTSIRRSVAQAAPDAPGPRAASDAPGHRVASDASEPRSAQQDKQVGRMRNALIVAIVCVFLAGPALIGAAEWLGASLPSWFTAQDAQFLSGGIAETSVSDNASLQGFASKQLQGALEDAVGNHIPAKASALLGNAALQRGAIEASNVLFRWPAYPTYFGSERLVVAQGSALTYMPTQATEAHFGQLEGFARGVKAAAERHPDMRFAVYLVQGYQTPSANPAEKLVAYNPLTARACAQALERVLGGTADGGEPGGNVPENAFFLTRSYDTEQEFFQDFFRSDHHWNAIGAINAYNQLAEALGLAAFVSPGTADFGDYRFSGATARWGLSTLEEEVFDTSQDFSHLLVEDAGGATHPFTRDSFFLASDLGKKHLFYDEYFSWTLDNGNTLVNAKGGNGRNALVVADSYVGALQHLVANEYSRTVVTWGLGGWNQDGDAGFEELLASGDYDDVFFVASPVDYCTFVARNPGYFDEAAV